MNLPSFLAALSCLYLTALRCVDGTYFFYAEVQSFSNPNDRDHDGGCCDPGCNSCENYFIFCLRQAGYDEDSNICPYGSFSTASDPDSGSQLQFDTGNDALAPNVDNPLRYAGNTWPGGFQLKIRAMDADPDADDLIDTWIIEFQTFLPTNEYTEFITYGGESSSSVQMTLRFRLRCRGNWHGHNCNIRCEDVDTDSAHLECALDGSHVCMSGWQDLSTDCTVPVCQEGCHLTGGTCNLPGECNCEPGWSGDLCDVCTPRDGCDHGYCTHPNDCTCEDGYGGTLCNIDLDPCGHQTPCVHGNCNNTGNEQYLCTCDAGYTGTDCDIDIDECDSQPCENGATCEDLINGFSCSCATGWTGDTCGDDIDECSELSPCKNGSTCANCVPPPPGELHCTLGYTCACVEGFYGDNCDLDIDHCSPTPCLNGGVCHDGLLDYTCECPPGFTGQNCETDFDYCQELQPCLNGATCTSLLTTELYRCDCAAGFTGRNCDINIDDCPGNSCVVETTRICVDGVQDYTCECLPGYTGRLCDEDIDECELFGCRNGGTCEDLVADFSCSCPELFSGKECEEPIDGDQCDPSPCLNGSTCVDELQGVHCEERSPPGPTSDPCGNTTCNKGETCVVIGTGKDGGHKCEPCVAATGVLLAGCDEEIAAQSDNESNSKDNTPIIIGPTVAGLVLLLLLLLLLVLCCCCRNCFLLLCPCLKRDKVDENETVQGTLSGPQSSVTHNAMYFGPDRFASGKSINTLPKNQGMQNPMYAAPGGVKSDSLSKVPLPFPNGADPYSIGTDPTYEQAVSNGRHSSYENVSAAGGRDKTALEGAEFNEEPPYEELGPKLMVAVADQYQKLSESTLSRRETQPGNSPYASLYSVPSANTNAPPVLPPPRPPSQYMALLGGPRPENPYVLDHRHSGSSFVTQLTASPEKTETESVKDKEMGSPEEETSSDDVKLASNEKSS